jgi:CO dehydrogenase maturation factor
MNNMVHFILQGKGGVGKSLIASLLTQHRIDSGCNTLPVDTDPVNKTLAAYKSLNVHEIHLLAKDSTNIDQSKFDKLIELILEHDGYEIIVDNGASSFIPLSSYLIENDVIHILHDNGVRIVIHVIISGESNLLTTLQGFKEIAEQFPIETDIVVWLNHYHGEIMSDGKPFEDMKVYKDNKHRVFGIITLPKQPDLFERDISTMQTQRLTFDEVASFKDGSIFGIMNKSRIHRFRKQVFSQLSVVFGGASG